MNTEKRKIKVWININNKPIASPIILPFKPNPSVTKAFPLKPETRMVNESKLGILVLMASNIDANNKHVINMTYIRTIKIL